jgi:hypothetical protein
MVTRARPSGRVDWSALPFHPILIAIFPVVFLFVQNAVQQVTLDPLWVPLAASLALATGALLLSWLLMHDLMRGALLASALLALFFSFGHVWNLVSLTIFADRNLVAAAWAVFAALAVMLVRLRGRWVVPANRFLNLVAAIVVAFNLAQLVGFATGVARFIPGEGTTAILPQVKDLGRRPDIYYIILDRYANLETLDRLFGYDNRPFMRELEARGFTVAEDAWANYLKTALSLLSSLSVDYLDAATLKDGEPSTFGPVHTALRGHLAVPATLRSLGYEYVHIGNYWEPTATNVDAHRVLRFEGGSEFRGAMVDTTLLSLLLPPSEADDDPESADFPQLARDHTLFAFERLEQTRGRPGPTFVFAHILVPHPPFVFDVDGSMPSADERRDRGTTQNYIRQLQWANQRVLRAIDALLDVPAGEEPVIVLQADEGPFPQRFAMDEHGFQWLEATPDEIQQKYGILNAFHLPGANPAALGVYDRMSPVNEFRIVFNAYFGAELPLLPDTVYLSPDYDHLYDFVEYQRP